MKREVLRERKKKMCVTQSNLVVRTKRGQTPFGGKKRFFRSKGSGR